jgi:nitrite reductase/ring-hydroxylating ferredoxin subunit/DMSO/TMAO reductase YedYZ heme-binding membrane subunit
MSAGFQAVMWNRKKIIYDAVVLGGMALLIGALITSWYLAKPPDGYLGWVELRLKAFGYCAFLMLTIILAVGPLARLDKRFLPLLYNRRHFGVLMFLTALLHASFMVEWYVAQGELGNLWNELTAWKDYAKFIGFPFKVLGLGALLILLVLASLSHDYWLAFLRPPVWKAVHMAIYVAYALAVMHVALGVLQDRDQPVFVPILFGASFVFVCGLHIAAALKERAVDRGSDGNSDGWLQVGAPSSIPDKAARIVTTPEGERIAVFRDGKQIGALAGVCAHQNGPIGEGCIVDGLVTCPWHGWQYRLVDGCAPPPFTEKIATHSVRLRDGVVEVDPRPLAPGTKAAITI